MFKERPIIIIAFCLIVMIATGVLQYLNPQLSLYDGGVIMAVLLTVLLKKDIYTLLFGIAGILLIAVSALYPHESQAVLQVVLQNLFAGLIVIVTMVAVLHIKKLYRSIESDQTQTNALFEHATEGIILTNGAGEIVLINPAALKLFHYGKEEVIGRPVDMLVPARLQHPHVKYRDGFYKQPSNRSMGHSRDLRAKTKEGSEFPVEVSLSFYKQKGETFVIAFVVDITSRKKTEEELIKQKDQLEKITADIRLLNSELENKVEERTIILKEALQQLELSQQELSEALNKEKELNEIKSRFVSMASHEFRTPLSTILSSAALIARYTKEDEQVNRDKHIKKIKESVRHLSELLEDFLSLGKLEEGKVKVEFSNFNVQEFANEIIEEIKVVLKPGQRIEFTMAGSTIFCTDKRLVKNILINLFNNAVKFSKQSDEINLVIKNENDTLQLNVIDKGIGISIEDQQHLFSSFYRGNNAGNIPGTGLGLHIVKRYAELLGGQITLQSSLGVGTNIGILFPAMNPTA